MSNKYQNKYRIPSARLQDWDYRWAAAYFITICTQNREHYLGEIKNGYMILSGAGILADVFWHQIKQHATNIELGEFVVMPNHIHGILILNDSVDGENENVLSNAQTIDVETRHALSLQPEQSPQFKQPDTIQSNEISSNEIQPIETPSNEKSQPLPKTIGQQRFQNQGKNSVSSIMGSYKSAVTKHANRLQIPFAWQPRFHDHIIRNAVEHNRISNYIINNAANWKDDKFYKN